MPVRDERILVRQVVRRLRVRGYRKASIARKTRSVPNAETSTACGERRGDIDGRRGADVVRAFTQEHSSPSVTGCANRATRRAVSGSEVAPLRACRIAVQGARAVGLPLLRSVS